MKLILASGSAYRSELLSRLRIPFEAMAPDIDESPRAGELPAALAIRLARSKAQV
ncbi:MAG: Maf family protein, partial [Lautropia sp.]